MRTYDAINEDVRAAIGDRDSQRLLALSDELEMLGTPQATARMHFARGQASAMIGDYPQALDELNRAKQIYESEKQPVHIADVLGSLGMVYRDMGEYETALEHHLRSLEIYQQSCDQQGIAWSTHNLGMVYQSNGDLAKALEYYRRALELFEQHDNLNNAAFAIANMAMIYTRTGDFPYSLELYQRALELFERLGKRLSAAWTVGNMGSLFRRIGDHAKALDHYSHALLIHEEYHDAAGVAQVISNMGLVYEERGDVPSALEYYRKALEICTNSQNRAGVVKHKLNILGALLLIENLDEAAALIDQIDAHAFTDSGMLAQYYANQATYNQLRDDLDAAKEYLEKALASATSAGLRPLVAAYHERLRDLAQKRNDFAGYVHHNSELSSITEELKRS